MGSSPSSVPIPAISRDLIRRNRSMFFGNADKKNYKELLQRDPMIQNAYFKMNPAKVAQYESSGVDVSSVVNNVSGEGPSPIVVEYESEFQGRYDNPEIIQKILFTVDNPELLHDEELGPNNTIPIRLYIAEPLPAVKELAPHLPAKVKFAVEQRLVGLFGMAHAALQIGDKMVHFLDNHFVKIDHFKASNALFLIKISESGRLPLTETVKRTIADVIVEWNTKAMYIQATSNCQDFVEDICGQLVEKCNLNPHDRLALSFNSSPLVKKYLDELVKHPERVQFSFEFKKEKRVVVWNSHRELDEWERTHKHDLTKEELDFLKGFHRAFQLRFAAAEVSRNDTLKWEGCTQGNPTIL